MARGGRRDTAESSSTTPRRVREAVAVAATVLVLAAAAALLGAFDGSRDAAASSSSSPVGHVYRSTSVEQGGRPDPAFAGATVWLDVGRGSLGVDGGCNDLGAALRVTATRFRVSEISQTLMGCLGDGVQRRDELLTDFFGGDPEWRTTGDRLVLSHGGRTITLRRDDLPPALPRTNPARPRDLVDARIGSGHFRTWPWELAGTWQGPFVLVDVVQRGGRTWLTMRARCRQLEAPVTIRRTTLVVRGALSVPAKCRSLGGDDFLDDVRAFYGGEVAWHLADGHLTLQRGRATLKLRAR
jgi:heat shock protein HslJ